jgi:hypothetical protein
MPKMLAGGEQRSAKEVMKAILDRTSAATWKRDSARLSTTGIRRRHGARSIGPKSPGWHPRTSRYRNTRAGGSKVALVGSMGSSLPAQVVLDRLFGKWQPAQ